nr:EcsC family protein [Aquibacillus albus]
MVNNDYVQEIITWEKLLESYQTNPYEEFYEKGMNQLLVYLRSSSKQKLQNNADQLLFYVHSYLQGSSIQQEAREAIIKLGKVFDPEVHTIEDLQSMPLTQLTYIAEKQMEKERMSAFVQGSCTGAGGILLSAIDLPVLAMINLKAVQLIGLSFGHKIDKPYEMMVSLKVFHAATLPKRFQKKAWDELNDEMNNTTPYLYEGKEEITNKASTNQLLQQLAKNILILMTRKKVVQGFPLIGIGIGALTNYQLTRKVTNFALRFYQKRYLVEHQILSEK